MGGWEIPATIPPFHIHLMQKAREAFGGMAPA